MTTSNQIQQDAAGERDMIKDLIVNLERSTDRQQITDIALGVA